MTAKLSDPERDQAAKIVAQFSVLVHAWQTNDFQEAAQAHAELERLGVRVQIPRRRPAGEPCSRHYGDPRGAQLPAQ